MKFGLIGYPLGHSFSKTYFTEKFQACGIPGFTYENFELTSLEEVIPLLHGDYFGFNVTIPYKAGIITYLNEIDPVAFRIQAVNTLVRTGLNSWKGFNTDVLGFAASLKKWIVGHNNTWRALVLGTGGASKAVCYALRILEIPYSLVSSGGEGDMRYGDISHDTMRRHLLIINTTPVGMEPHVDASPDIPYAYLTSDHWLFDLIYNPVNTLFLTHGQQAGARTKNGLEMLHFQADHAWAIWKTYGKF